MFRTAIFFALTFSSSTALASGWLDNGPGFGNGDDCNSSSYTNYRDDFIGGSSSGASSAPSSSPTGGVGQNISPVETPAESVCHLMGPMFAPTCTGAYWMMPLWGLLHGNGLTVGNYFDF